MRPLSAEPERPCCRPLSVAGALLLALLPLALGLGSPSALGASAPSRPGAAGPAAVSLPGAGKKIPIDANFSFSYEFDRRPALGAVILKIRLFAADGSRSTALDVKGSADMPSMRGAHYSGDRPFRVSKRGDYLLPLDIVMPGEWEVQLLFSSRGAVIYRGALRFDV